MKRKLRTRFIMVLCILVGTTILTGCGIRYITSTNVLMKKDGIVFKVDKKVVDSITEIKIRTRIAQVEIIPANDFYVEIDYMYWDKEPEYSLEKGLLYFNDQYCFPDSYSINFPIDNKIKVYLPEANLLEQLWIENSSGDVEISDFKAKDLELTISYGDLKINKAAASKADISLSSGASYISDFQVGDLDFTNSYGDAEFTNINIGDSRLPKSTFFDKFQLSLSSGDVKIIGLQSNLINITNSYGDVTLEEVTANDGDFELSSGNLEIVKTLIHEINCNSSYGDATLSLLTAATDYNLDLSTSYGKIKVDQQSYEDNIQIDNHADDNITANLSSGDITVRFDK